MIVINKNDLILLLHQRSIHKNRFRSLVYEAVYKTLRPKIAPGPI